MFKRILNTPKPIWIHLEFAASRITVKKLLRMLKQVKNLIVVNLERLERDIEVFDLLRLLIG